MRLKGWKIGFYWFAWIVCLGLLSCEKEALETPDDNLCLYIQVPSAQTTKAISDPGLPTQEGEDWDRLAVIFVYEETNAEENNKIIVKNISKSEFYNFPNSTDYPGFKAIPLYIDPGTVYIYGVTYSENVYGDLTSAIEGCSTKDVVEQLTISNDYGKELNEDGSAKEGTLDYAKFLSVATGYYKDSEGDPADYDINADGTGTPNAVMTLTRLAAKIDIQWDAVDAYDQGYTDVKVTGFNFKGTKVGRLFPDIAVSEYKEETNTKTFYNNSEISQRNGRVYHYTFPDGVSVPSVIFKIDAEKSDATIPDDGYSYTLNFTSALQQATWYKVNATIKGITGDGTITLSN